MYSKDKKINQLLSNVANMTTDQLDDLLRDGQSVAAL